MSDLSLLTVVTGNQHKLAEMKKILAIDLLAKDLSLTEIQSLDILKVAHAKAEQAWEKLKKPLIVEDTGLTFSAFNGLPGPLVKHFLKAIGAKGLIKMLADHHDRSALAQCAIIFVDKNGQHHEFLGEVRGTISSKIIGGNGFGWDPIFIPNGYQQTFAQMSGEQKNQISHRRRALEKLQKFLSKRYFPSLQ